MQINFSKNDGSLFVNFPYYKHKQGIAGHFKFPANLYSHNLNLIKEGKVTSHLVKYSHHPDGEAHFSQDGRVLTTIKKKSLRLCEVDDHIFTVLFQGISNFSYADRKRDIGHSFKRTTLIILISNWNCQRQLKLSVDGIRVKVYRIGV